MLPESSTWDGLVRGFGWSVPPRFNMAEATVDRHSAVDRVAIVYDDRRGEPRSYTFADLSQQSNRLANVLAGLGVGRGERVALFLPQRPEVVLTHLAAWKLGAVSVPLTTMFGPQALGHRLSDAAPVVMVAEACQADFLRTEVFPLLDRPPLLLLVDAVGPISSAERFDEALAVASPRCTAVPTTGDDPAFLSYTSGTTGPAKGVLHAHRTLLGHLPGFLVSHCFPPQAGDRFWTPADWAWMGGFMDVVFPALHLGLPVLAAPRRFDPDEAWHLAARHSVRNTFLPPTALRLMRATYGPATPQVRFRTIGSGGESLGADTLAWARETLHCTINEFYGQTEVNLVVSNCAPLFEPKPGSMGRPVPGYRVAVLDANLCPVGPEVEGEICVGADAPGAFLGYFNNPEATRQKVVNGWIRTGDAGRVDGDGHVWFAFRTDDVITSAGYRIGPGEIEDCLVRHPAVRLAAAIGVPDPVRTEVVKAYIELKPDATPSPALEKDIREFVRRTLASYLYPRMIEFIDAIPLTATGKVRRAELRQRNRRERQEQETVT